jgi:hypothetical protein
MLCGICVPRMQTQIENNHELELTEFPSWVHTVLCGVDATPVLILQVPAEDSERWIISPTSPKQ